MRLTMPKQLYRVKTFVVRVELKVEGDEWIPLTEVDLDATVNQWITETQSQVIQAPTPPQVAVYASEDQTHRTMFLTLTLLYVPAVEQQNEQSYGRGNDDGKLGFGPPATDPGDTAVVAKASDGISRRQF